METTSAELDDSRRTVHRKERGFWARISTLRWAIDSIDTSAEVWRNARLRGCGSSPALRGVVFIGLLPLLWLLRFRRLNP